MIKFEVGKPFPGPVPAQEGAHLELWGDGLVCLIQMPGITRQEKQAFKKSFKAYAYLETDTAAPVSVWVFKFPLPLGPIDVNFNARIVKSEYIENYLMYDDGKIKNAITFYLLDRHILKAIKLIGLRPEAVEVFHNTIRKQLSVDYNQPDYEKYLGALYQYTTEELFKLGRQFKK